MISKIGRGKDQLSRWLSERVAQELEIPVEEVDVDASIMALGIDSLTLVAIAGQLAEYLDQEIDAEVVWEHDTVGKLASHFCVEAAGGQNDCDQSFASDTRVELTGLESRLRILRSGSGRSVVVSVGFPNIASILETKLDSDVTVGWLKLDDSESEAVRSPEIMASAFMEEIEEVDRSKAITLVGYSYGGTIAFELGCQLQSNGRDVRLVLLEPCSVKSESWADKVTAHLKIMRNSPVLRWPRYATTKAGIVGYNFAKKLFRQRQTDPRMPVHKPRSGKSWEDQQNRIWDSFQNYHPNTFSGVVAVGGRSVWLNRRLHIWQELTDQEIVTVAVHEAKDHHDFRFGVGADVWVELIKRWNERLIPAK